MPCLKTQVTNGLITRQEAIARVQRVLWRDRLWERIGYVPTPKQQEVHDAIANGARFVQLTWARRSGKSIGPGATEALTEMAFGPIGQMPKRIINTTGPEADVTERVFNYLWKWIVDEEVFGVKPIHKSVRLRYIEMPWKARVEGKTTENPDSLLGDGVAIQIADEHARDRSDILDQYLLPPLFDTNGKCILISSPQGKLNHYHDTWEAWSEKALIDPEYFTSQATSYDNPYNNVAALDEYCKTQIKKGNRDLVRQEIFAEFTALSGSVYPMFSSTKGNKAWHVDKNLRPVENIGFTNGYDWGFDNPFVALFAQVVPGDILLIHDIIYLAGMTDDECAQAVLRKKDEWKDRVPLGIKQGHADPSAPEAIKVFRQYGISIGVPTKAKDVARINSVSEGIRKVRGFFYREDRPAIVIHPRVVQLISEVAAYHFKKKTLREEPNKINDHSPDALRYLVMGAFGGTTIPFLYLPKGKGE